MAKKNRIYDFDDEDDIVIDKKTKRRMERAKNRENQQQQQRAQEEVAAEAAAVDESNDVMSQIAVLCQENRWREAVLTARQALAEAEASDNENKDDIIIPLSMAIEKLEMSLRRQMAAAFLNQSEEMLKKEYLLNVGE